MNYSIENDYISLIVSTKGAEIQHFTDKRTGTDYMWSGDPEFWAKKSPLLFPIVGTLKENTYYFNDKAYQLGRHGFARDHEYQLEEQTKNSLLFTLKANEETQKAYPFLFELSIFYTVTGKKLSVTYIIKNTDKKYLYFSVGGHPAFKLPMFDGDVYDDYILEFDKTENAGRWPISKDGLIEAAPTPLLKNTKTLPLKKELFYTDAIVFKNLNSQSVKLLSVKQNRGIQFDFPGFPYLGIWAAKNADFVCIEPWCGIADSVNTDQSFITKEGINKISTGSSFERTWSVSLIEK